MLSEAASCQECHLMWSQEVYMAVVQQLARRGFRLSSLLDFWERLLEGDDYMPQFDPRCLATERERARERASKGQGV